MLPAFAALALALAVPGPAVPAPGDPAAKAPRTPTPLDSPHRGPDGRPVCARCHEPGQKGVRGDAIALCARCHDAARMRHPFRVEAPAGAGAAGLPLLGGKFVACHTCHDPHDVAARPHGLRDDFTVLCKKCHGGHKGEEPRTPPGHPSHPAVPR